MTPRRAIALAAALVLVGLGLCASAAAPVESRRGALRQEAAAPVRFVVIDVIVDAGDAGLAAFQIEVIAPGQEARPAEGDARAAEDDARARAARLVGVEAPAGLPPDAPFADTPTYDPAALARGRVIIAGYSAQEPARLPGGAVRVARLHWRLPAAATPATAPAPTTTPAPATTPAPTPAPAHAADAFRVRLIAAADAAGARVSPPVRLEVVPR